MIQLFVNDFHAIFWPTMIVVAFLLLLNLILK